MKLLIIGSKGFIGSNLLKFFSSNLKFVVYGCDIVPDYSTNHYFTLDNSNTNFSKVFEQIKFDICINCSGSASVPESFVHTQRDFQLNTANVFLILDAIRKVSPFCRFINISSAAVYGNPNKLPISEKSSLAPLSPYAYHKLQSELLCEEFNRLHGISTCSLRVFSAYGNGLAKQLFWDVWNKIRRKNHISLYGTGEESRDFIHINDIARVVELVIENGNFTASVYNVGNGEEIFIGDVVRQFCDFAGWSGTVEFVQKVRTGDPVNWCADISSIKSLGFEKIVPIEQGLKNYIRWARELN
jgi:dTDP-glucose 4,6-dehydratase/UDP-glucose 4-epimerase